MTKGGTGRANDKMREHNIKKKGGRQEGDAGAGVGVQQRNEEQDEEKQEGDEMLASDERLATAEAVLAAVLARRRRAEDCGKLERARERQVGGERERERERDRWGESERESERETGGVPAPPFCPSFPPPPFPLLFRCSKDSRSCVASLVCVQCCRCCWPNFSLLLAYYFHYYSLKHYSLNRALIEP